MISQHQICYELHGNPHHPCIVLITGIGGQLIDWPSLFINGLVGKGFYVVTLDNRDSGLSRSYDECGVLDLQQLMREVEQGKKIHIPYTLLDLAQDVVTLMEDLHIQKAHLIGHSMGGIVAQYVAINFPDRVNSLICLATTSGDPQLPPSKPEVTAYFTTAMNVANLTVDEKINNKLELFKIYQHPDYFNEEETRKQITKSIQRANHPDGFKRLMVAMISQSPRTMQLKQLQCPSLIIHGEYDPVFPLEHGKQLSACIPGSHLKIFEKMGHLIPNELCKEMVEVINKFLINL